MVDERLEVDVAALCEGLPMAHGVAIRVVHGQIQAPSHATIGLFTVEVRAVVVLSRRLWKVESAIRVPVLILSQAVVGVGRVAVGGVEEPALPSVGALGDAMLARRVVLTRLALQVQLATRMWLANSIRLVFAEARRSID